MSFTVHHRLCQTGSEKQKLQQTEPDDPTCEMSLSTMESDPAELVSTSLSDLGFASMDMDRHYRSTSRIRQDDSYCDGLGESMFGESFAIDDVVVHSGENQRRNQAAPHLSPVADEETEESTDEAANTEQVQGQ